MLSMTTYQYTLAIDDSEYLYLEQIFNKGIEDFKRDYPDMAHHKCRAQVLLEKLKKSCESAEMMSSSFFVPNPTSIIKLKG